MYSELKVVTVYNDVEKFEKEVNGWCCNCGYKIISCDTQIIERLYIVYTAFLGKN